MTKIWLKPTLIAPVIFDFFLPEQCVLGLPLVNNTYPPHQSTKHMNQKTKIIRWKIQRSMPRMVTLYTNSLENQDRAVRILFLSKNFEN